MPTIAPTGMLYRLDAEVTDPGQPVINYNYHEQNEHCLFMKIDMHVSRICQSQS